MKFIYKNLHTLFFFLTVFSIISCSKSPPQLHLLNNSAVILAFGDSLTYGVGTRLETSYPSKLSQLLSLKVVNAGVPGEETSGGLLRISHLLSEVQPQLVIVCLGGNDLLHRRAYSQIKENLKNVIQIIKQQGIQVVLIAVPAPHLSLDVPAFYKELGEEFSIPVEENVLGKLLGVREYKSDLIHLNTLGYDLMAQAIYRLLVDRGAVKG